MYVCNLYKAHHSSICRSLPSRGHTYHPSINTYIHTDIHTQLDLRLSSNPWKYSCIYVHIHIHTYTHTSIYIYIYIYTHTYIHSLILDSVPTRGHTYPYIHTNIHTYIHKQLDPRLSSNPWTEEEDRKIVAAQSRMGNRWQEMSKRLDGR